MNEESLHSWMEPEFEARIIALILGEASDFEKEELENRIAESPEANLFYQRMANLHALLATIPLRSEKEDSDWKLSPERREKLLATIGQPRKTGVADGTSTAAPAPAGPGSISRGQFGKRGKWKQILPVAASIALLGLMATALLSTLPGVRIAATGIDRSDWFAYTEAMETDMVKSGREEDNSVAPFASNRASGPVDDRPRSSRSMSLDDLEISPDGNTGTRDEMARRSLEREASEAPVTTVPTLSPTAEKPAPGADRLYALTDGVMRSAGREVNRGTVTQPGEFPVEVGSPLGRTETGSGGVALGKEGSTALGFPAISDAEKDIREQSVSGTLADSRSSGIRQPQTRDAPDSSERAGEEARGLSESEAVSFGLARNATKSDTDLMDEDFVPPARPLAENAPGGSSSQKPDASPASPLSALSNSPNAAEDSPERKLREMAATRKQASSEAKKQVRAGAAPAEPAARASNHLLAVADPFEGPAQAGGGAGGGGALVPGMEGLSRLNVRKKSAPQKEKAMEERSATRAGPADRKEELAERQQVQTLEKEIDEIPRKEAAQRLSRGDRVEGGEMPETRAVRGRGQARQAQIGDHPVSVTNGFLERETEESRFYDFEIPALEEKSAEEEPFSTFSLHVGDSSFHLARAALARSQWPERESIRVEEFVNALDYRDRIPTLEEKVGVALDQARQPFRQQRNLLRISLATAAGGRATSTPLRLTLLLDNSGSMERPDRRQTVQRAFALLLAQLRETDEVTLISFARQPRLLADRVGGAEAAALTDRIATLPSEGGTNLEAALDLAFQKAREQQVPNAQNRIILLTDGAANLGDAEPARLGARIETFRDAGIAFDAAGIGARGLNDEILEALTRRGDGRYYLLDRPEDADAGFARQVAGALRPAAGNVKVQVEFNPERVGAYQLIGFEKHRLEKEDFRNDAVDAAELAAAEAGVALYQVEAKPDGTGDIGSVSVRFRDLATGEMVEKRWPILYDPNTPPLEQAAPAIRVAGAAAFLASRLRENALGLTVDLETLNRLLNNLPSLWQRDEGIQQLREMVQQTRSLASE